jgi:hypothetical protein
LFLHWLFHVVFYVVLGIRHLIYPPKMLAFSAQLHPVHAPT